MVSALPCGPFAGPPLVPSQFAFLRFVAGMRALFALLAGSALFIQGAGLSPWAMALTLGYLLLAAGLLVRTLLSPPLRHAERWLWVDAAVLALISRILEQNAEWLAVIIVVPVVGMSLLAGPRHGLWMAVASAAVMLLPGPKEWQSQEWLNIPLAVPMAVLGFAPAAAFLTLPNRQVRQRMELIEAFTARADPRQGLLHHVDVLLEMLIRHFDLDAAVLSVRGPEPRLFQRRRDSGASLLGEADAERWRERRAALPDAAGCLYTASGHQHALAVSLESFGGESQIMGDEARQALRDMAPETIALPLMSYGKPLGHLCLMRRARAFKVSDLQWLNDAMRELLPLLERSDLLEQLQRETAAGERERIGRDLHDSAVQPYLGLKYGLEALARQAGPDNPVAPYIRQLVELTTEELQTLRDVVTGLRKGNDPTATTPFVEALRRQAARFDALYGLKVHVLAHDTPRLRGAIAKAALHMFNEALTNVRRHTAATTVTVTLETVDDRILLRIRNDLGTRGMPAPAFVPRSLSERATEAGGSVTVHVREDSTEVEIALPLHRAIA